MNLLEATIRSDCPTCQRKKKFHLFSQEREKKIFLRKRKSEEGEEMICQKVHLRLGWHNDRS